MILEHFQAVKALIPTTSPAFTVHLFDVPASPTFPYVVLWADPGRHYSETLDSTPHDLLLNVRATCVGATGESCLVVLDAVRAALNRKSPVVAGRKVHELVQSPLSGVQPDKSVTITATGTHPVFAVDEYELRSEPL